MSLQADKKLFANNSPTLLEPLQQAVDRTQAKEVVSLVKEKGKKSHEWGPWLSDALKVHLGPQDKAALGPSRMFKALNALFVHPQCAKQTQSQKATPYEKC